MAKKSSQRSRKGSGQVKSQATGAAPAAGAGSDGGVTPVAGDGAASAAVAAPKARSRGKRGPAKRSAKAKPRSKPQRSSGLDAAADVLAAVGQPMRCGEIVDRMLAKGLWKTGGKTPAATINAAIIREIRSKGKQSRFRKTGRGLFTAAKGG